MLLRQLWALFTRRERRFLLLLLLLDFGGALLELVGIGAVVPFVLFLATPGALERNRFLHELYLFFEPASERNFLLLLAVLAAAFFVLKNLYLPAVFYCRQSFLRRKYLQLVETLYANYLYLPYVELCRKSGAELLRNVQLTASVSLGLLTPAFNLATEALTVLAIFGFLVVLNPVGALVVSGVFAVVVLGFMQLQRNWLRRLGERRLAADAEMISGVTQSLSSVRETRLLGVEPEFRRRFGRNAAEVGSLNVASDLVAVLPRYVIETLAVVFLMAVLAFLVWRGAPSEELVIGLTVLGMAAIRLMPAVTRASVAIANIRHYLPSFNLVYHDWRTLRKEPESPAPGGAGTFSRELRLEHVGFTYPGQSAPALSDVSLTIRPGERIGIVGGSGAGKSTLLDLILGLLEPESGTLTLDGEALAAVRGNWWRQLGCVPQKVFLFNDTIRNNIALGVPPERIDESALRRAAHLAKLDELLARLPQGLATRVGDGGVLLSGGERQRIGIARALYRDPAVLVLDEATAALDNVTERKLIRSLEALPGRRTLLMIAHRLSTVEHCDRILLFDHGRLVAAGSYQELLATSARFRELAYAPEERA